MVEKPKKGYNLYMYVLYFFAFILFPYSILIVDPENPRKN